MNPAIEEAVTSVLRENPEARETYDAILQRGHSPTHAREEIARALVACLWESWHGKPDRWRDVLRELREGRSTADLLPD
jgi:hypothetical protein